VKRKLAVLIIMLFVFLGGVGTYAYTRVKAAMDQMYSQVDQEAIRDEDLALGGTPFSILLLGIDRTAKRDSGRSDTMIVATVNPQKQSIILQSIERDTLVEIVGMGFEDKINHAYAYGGAEMAINTVQQFLEVPIDYYVEMDMKGLKSLIDAVGGIAITNDRFEFEYEGNYFPMGKLHLNGSEALAYSRMRYEDPEGDYGRQIRQRQIITALIKKGSTFQLTRYESILAALGSHMKTNLKLGDMIDISTRYHPALKLIEEYSLHGDNTIIDGVFYLKVNEEQRLEAVQRLRTHLELE